MLVYVTLYEYHGRIDGRMALNWCFSGPLRRLVRSVTVHVRILTEFPVQKIGHFSHGASRERTQVLKYGFRTINGKTGGVSVEALARAATAACASRLSFMVGKRHEIESKNEKRVKNSWPGRDNREPIQRVNSQSSRREGGSRGSAGERAEQTEKKTEESTRIYGAA